MKILVIGGVAGGATAAARLRRLSETAEITLLERGPYVSFANCGLPYFLSGDIEKRSQLLLQTPEGFESRYAVKVHVDTEAIAIDRAARRVVTRGPQGEQTFAYDRLILAQGSNPILPALAGADSKRVFRLWTVPDMDRLQAFLKQTPPQSVVVAGGGFIGIEMAEAFHKRGVKVTIVEASAQIMTTMDHEFAQQIREHLVSQNIAVETGHAVQRFEEATSRVVLDDGRSLSADAVLFSVGARPELTLAKEAGLALGASGGLLVDEHLRTEDPAIWAAGDMVEIVHRVSGRRVRVPLAGPANRQGRIAATNALGGDLSYRGAWGTSIVKIFEATAASTGLTETAARAAGYWVGVAVVHKDHHAGYYPGARPLTLKIVYDREQGAVLGAQAFGLEGVDKRIDVLSTALAGRLTVHDLAELDLAYAPPYSSANDPVNLIGFVAQNDLSGFSPLVTATEAASAFQPETHLVLDVRNLGERVKGFVPGSLHIPLDELRQRLNELDAKKTVFVHCAVGFRGHLAVRILKENGFESVANITGGYTSMKLSRSFQEEVL